MVFVGSADGVLYAIDLETGGVEWRFETEGASNSSAEFGFDRKTIQSSPALTTGAVLFGSRDGKFYAVDAASGGLRWRYDHSTPWVVSSAAIHDNLAIVGTSDGLFVHASTSRRAGKPGGSRRATACSARRRGGGHGLRRGP